MSVEREIRVEGVFFGSVVSAKVGECEQENSDVAHFIGSGYKYLYGYVLTKGEEETLVSADFGYENIGDALNACKAAALDRLYRVRVDGNVLSLE